MIIVLLFVLVILSGYSTCISYCYFLYPIILEKKKTSWGGEGRVIRRREKGRETEGNKHSLEFNSIIIINTQRPCKGVPYRAVHFLLKHQPNVPKSTLALQSAIVSPCSCWTNCCWCWWWAWPTAIGVGASTNCWRSLWYDDSASLASWMGILIYL